MQYEAPFVGLGAQYFIGHPGNEQFLQSDYEDEMNEVGGLWPETIGATGSAIGTPEGEIDVRSLVRSMVAESRSFNGGIVFITFVLYFIVLIVILELGVCIECANDTTRQIKDNLIDKKYYDGTLKWKYSLLDVDNYDKMWEWATQIWAPFLFATKMEYGTDVFQRQGTNINATEFFMFENKIAQLPFIEQERQSEIPCKTGILKTYRTCIDLGSRSTETYGAVNQFTAGSDGTFKYRFWMSGDFSTVDQKAQIVRVTNAADVALYLTSLRSGGWVDRFTGWVRFQVFFWNPNTNIVTMLRVVFTQPGIGTLQPFVGMYSHRSFKHRGSALTVGRIVDYVTVRDYVRMGFEIIFVILTIAFSCWEGYEVYKAFKYGGHGWVHFDITTSSGKEHFFDLIVLLVTYFAIIAHMLGIFDTVSKNDKFLLSDDFSDTWGYISYLTNTILIVLFTFCLLKYARFNRRWEFLTSTLRRALPELSNFTGILLLILLGYSYAGYYYFGTSLWQFRNIFRSLQTFLLQAVSAPRLPYEVTEEPEADNTRTLIPIFLFWSFIFIVYFILINMFLAIILRSYEATMRELNDRTLVARSFSKRFREPFHAPLLNVLRQNKWVDQAYVNVPIGSGGNFLYSRGCLRIRLKFSSGSHRHITSARNIFILLPSSWRARVVHPQIEWFLQKDKNELRYTARAELTHPGLVTVENNLYYEYSKMRRAEKLVLVLPLILRKPGRSSQHRMYGECLPSMTADGHLALGLGDVWAGCDYVIRKDRCTSSELLEACHASSVAKEPKPSWMDAVSYCAIMFEPPDTDDEEAKAQNEEEGSKSGVGGKKESGSRDPALGRSEIRTSQGKLDEW